MLAPNVQKSACFGDMPFLEAQPPKELLETIQCAGRLVRTHKEKVASVLDMVKFSPVVAKTREDTQIAELQELLLEQTPRGSWLEGCCT